MTRKEAAIRRKRQVRRQLMVIAVCLVLAVAAVVAAVARYVRGRQEEARRQEQAETVKAVVATGYEEFLASAGETVETSAKLAHRAFREKAWSSRTG